MNQKASYTESIVLSKNKTSTLEDRKEILLLEIQEIDTALANEKNVRDQFDSQVNSLNAEIYDYDHTKVSKWIDSAKNFVNKPNLSQNKLGVGGYGNVSSVERSDGQSKLVLVEKSFQNKSDLTTEWSNRRLLGDQVTKGIVTFIALETSSIVMRHYNNTLATLSRKLDSTKKLELIPTILLQLCKGLDHMNQKNYLHNDIKPANIFINYISDEVEAVLGDLGSMAQRGNIHSETPLYDAPEHDQKNYSSTRSDIYSLGLSMIEFIEGNYNKLEKYRQDPTKVPDNCPYRSLFVSMISLDLYERPKAIEIITQFTKS